MATVIIPFPFRKHTDNQREVDINEDNLALVMQKLVQMYPGLSLINEQPALLSMFINGRQVRKQVKNWSDVALQPEDEVSLIIPIAGG